ncbi:hypothetical protein JCM10213v2_007973 [Rhodosporidiobolus nylandii]
MSVQTPPLYQNPLPAPSLLSSFPSLSSDVDLAKALLPDGTLTARGSTHLDEPVTLYFAPGGGGKEDCRAFRVGKGAEGELVPSVYALDLVPGFLQALETAPMVVENLVSGSDLFISGVSPRSLSSLPPSSKEGDLVAVTIRHPSSDGQGQQVVAVGLLAASRDELIKMQKEGKKGAAVHTLHARGDFLWQSGSQVEASPLPSASTTSSAAPVDTTDDEEEEPAPAAAAPGAVEALAFDLASTSVSPSSPPSSAPPAAAELTPQEVDSILLRALCLSIRQTLSLPSSSSLFPMSASTLYSSYILPYRPAPSPSSSFSSGAEKAEIKKSTWKKLDKFVKEVSGAGKKKGGKTAEMERLIEAKEVRGEWTVLGVNGSHPDVESLRPYRTIAQESAAASSAASAADPSSAAANGSSSAAAAEGGVEVTEYYKPSSSSVAELLSHIPHERPPSGMYTTSQLSTLLKTFTTTYTLSHPRQPKLLLLSPTAHPSPSTLPLESLSAMELLAAVVLDRKKGETPQGYGREAGRAGCVARETVLERVREGCTVFFGVRRGKGGEEVIKKGHPPVIKVQIKNVGKRQVTLVSGHEPWALFTSEEFAEELKHKSASSTSVQPLAGSAKKGQTPRVEVMCQGTHDELVLKLLTTKYGIPKRFVEVDTSKSKK